MNPYLVERLQPYGTTIFAEMSALAVETGAINLGQGFPDTDGPEVVKQAAVDAIEAGYNQYPPGIGIPELRTAIAAHQRRFYRLEYDSAAEVLVTAGATEAIAAAMLALCGPGDEVVTFEPYYDSYAACIAMSGASRRVVTLRAPDYAFDPDELRAAITPRTKLILLNSPHNPTGKVFSRAELTLIAGLAQEHDLLVVTDEVYEHLVYDGEHVPIATLPGMRDRTVTIGSGGKSFSFTGWKVGWVCARPELVDRGEDREAVPHVREQRAVSVRDRSRPRASRRVLRALPRPRCATNAIDCAPGSRTRASTYCDLRAPISRRSTSDPSASPTVSRSAVRCPIGVGSSRCRASCSTTTSLPARRSCDSRAASGQKCSTRRAHA